MPRLVIHFAAASLAVVLPLLTACGSASKCDTPANCTAGSTTAGTGGGGTGGGGGQGGGMFRCKDVMCPLGTDACQVTTQFHSNATGKCIPLPAACASASADCTCFGDLMGCTCQKEPDGTFAVFCDVEM